MADLLFLHGFALSKRTWNRAIPQLQAAGHRCVAYDRLGFGEAHKPRGPHHYTAEATLAEAMRVIDEHELDRPVVIGHSGGGTLALQIALAAPDRVDSLVLLAPAVLDDGPPKPVRSVFSLPGVAPALQRLTWGRAGALIDMTVAWRPTELADRLGEVLHPTRVITGDRDRIVPRERSLEVARRMPNASAVTLENCGHMVHTERPDHFVEIVKAFIERRHR